MSIKRRGGGGGTADYQSVHEEEEEGGGGGGEVRECQNAFCLLARPSRDYSTGLAHGLTPKVYQKYYSRRVRIAQICERLGCQNTIFAIVEMTYLRAILIIAATFFCSFYSNFIPHF